MADETLTTRIRDVEQMPVYQGFFQLVLDAECATTGFGPDFRWLRAQCLRSSESVCANMTEGFYSQYSTEYLQALYRCRREARETMAHLRYASAVGQLPEDGVGVFVTRFEECLFQLSNLIGSIERKIHARGKSKDLCVEVREAREDYEFTDDDPPSGTFSINHQPSTIP